MSKIMILLLVGIITGIAVCFLYRDGDISAEIYDMLKQTAVRLNSEVREGCIHAEKGKRYYLVIRFRSATGGYVLRYSDCKE